MKGRPVGQVFLLLGKPYRWDGPKLVRVPDGQATCSAVLEREGVVLRCEKLSLHDGKHSTTGSIT